MGRNTWSKYPPCPECGAVGSAIKKQGLTTTKLENRLRCRSCNAMFEFKISNKFRVIIGESLGDKKGV